MVSTTAPVADESPFEKILADMKAFARQPATTPSMKNFIENYLMEALRDLDERVEAAGSDDDGEEDAALAADLARRVSAVLDVLVPYAEAASQAAGWSTDAGMTDDMPETWRAPYAQMAAALTELAPELVAIVAADEEDDDEEDEAAQ